MSAAEPPRNGSNARGGQTTHPIGARSITRSSGPTRELFGFHFVDASSFGPTIDRLLGQQPDDGLLPLVVTPNVDDIVQLSDPAHSDLLSAERQARYVLPDGQPIVWTSRLIGEPLSSRLPGSALFPPLWGRIVRDQRRVLLIASSDEVANGLRAQYAELITLVPPFFQLDDAPLVQSVTDQALELIRTHQPEFVFLGIGFPKQQRLALGLIHALREEGLPLPVFLLLGGSFNMHLGLTPRAPQWVQRLGVEFLYRFAHEPRRLFRRYFLTDVRFLPMMIREVRTRRRATGDRT